ncbi:MAG: hypothetical protein JRJ20_08890 [Deltaproteobacteria bacterium]|nr:hypothetical protein [Deltaproteobacteria bacterium]
MDWIEIIQLRSYSRTDCDAAVVAFHELSSPDRESGLEDVVLLRNTVLDTDMAIFINWRVEVPQRGKSHLGSQLVAAFSEYGQIYHSVWTYETKLALKQGSKSS